METSPSSLDEIWSLFHYLGCKYAAVLQDARVSTNCIVQGLCQQGFEVIAKYRANNIANCTFGGMSMYSATADNKIHQTVYSILGLKQQLHMIPVLISPIPTTVRATAVLYLSQIQRALYLATVFNKCVVKCLVAKLDSHGGDGGGASMCNVSSISVQDSLLEWCLGNLGEDGTFDRDVIAPAIISSSALVSSLPSLSISLQLSIPKNTLWHVVSILLRTHAQQVILKIDTNNRVKFEITTNFNPYFVSFYDLVGVSVINSAGVRACHTFSDTFSDTGLEAGLDTVPE